MDTTLQQFSELTISQELKRGIKELGYVAPTDFQWGVFESFAQGKNILGEGQSNYGKSLAFALPILSKINPNEKNPQALILGASANQTDLCAKECKALGRHLDIRVGNTLEIEELKPHVLVWSFDDLVKADVLELIPSLHTVYFDGLSSNNMAKALEILSDLFTRKVQVLIFGQEAIDECKRQDHPILKDAVTISNCDQPENCCSCETHCTCSKRYGA